MIKKTYQVEKDNYQDAGKASSDIKKTLKALQIDRKILKAVAIASYEAEINIAIHSNGGTVTFELALTPGYSTASLKARELGFGAGMGLYNMKSVASSFKITSSKEGTHIKMTFK